MKVRRPSSTKRTGADRPAARTLEQPAGLQTRAPRRTASTASFVHGFNHSTVPESAIALVVTLILLAVITFMAVTFLVVSTTGKQNSNTLSQEIVARNAADVAFEQANASLIANMMAFTN